MNHLPAILIAFVAPIIILWMIALALYCIRQIIHEFNEIQNELKKSARYSPTPRSQSSLGEK